MSLNDAASYQLFDSLTYSNIFPATDTHAVTLSLSIDKLDEMPSYSDVIDALQYMLSWVSMLSR